MSARRAVVIGGGVAGLHTAALLAREGYDVDLVEQRPTVGGRAGVWEADGFRFDTGPSWYLMPEVFEHAFRLLGTDAATELDLVRLDPAYRVFFEGRGSLDVRTGEAPGAFERVEPGAGAALERYLASARTTYELATDRFLWSTWGREAWTPDLLRRAPRLVQLLSVSLHRYVARRFADPRLRQVLGYPAVFLGTEPRRAPALYHLMSHADLTEGVLYPRGGIGEVVGAFARLAERLGVRVRTSTRATGIHVDREAASAGASRARVRAVEVEGPDGPTVLDAEVVVGAGDLHDLETRLVPADLRTYPERWWARRDPGPGVVLVMLGVRGRVPELAHHSLFFTADWDANFAAIRARTVPEPASMYVCAPSRTDPSVAPAEHENLFVLVPVPADPAIGHGGLDGRGDPVVERVADAAVARLAAWARVPDLAERVVVRRTVGPADFAHDLSAWSGGALGPAHTLRQSAMLRARGASRHVDGLLYAGGSTTPGIGLPMCLISAELVIKRLRGDATTGPLAEPVAVAP
ncbi:phytoene desaturase family protein [Cellulomonas alba]|uniref:Phytoene desaturase family protein n=1 Tax=Cellulomonas alba TaxID=3053467 RepID=A0ABT7SBD9_9CELL|nr:phytoene desaturase family protein [Cellulomonas alba]MDM7853497.1 phytoene desaturase family protein [Cellulomonas alba]